jgi:hypothetical protein
MAQFYRKKVPAGPLIEQIDVVTLLGQPVRGIAFERSTREAGHDASVPSAVSGCSIQSM